MPWSVRIMLRRAVAQRTIIATVLAVAILGSTLLGTFALLLTSTEQRALAVTLIRSPPSATDLETQLSIGRNDANTALAAARTALAEVTGDVPTTSSEWVVSPPYQLPGDSGSSVPLGYLAAMTDVGELATLRSGAWPEGATDAAGRVQVAVPSVAAQHFAWSVGSEVPLVSTSTLAAAQAVVVGVYDLTGDRERWARDLLAGAGTDPDFPVPGSFGFLLTSAYGPFVAAPEALLGGDVEVSSADVVVHPQLDGASGASLDDLRARLGTAGRDVQAAVGPHVTSMAFASELAGTIDSAQGQLAVTRVSVVVVGLMLAVLAITVLLLAARLLAERRAAEQSLMASRGATGGQVLALAGLEALLVAGVTAAVAPLLARLLYRLTTAQDVFRRAGLDVDPHLPVALWLTCAAASLVFAGVLLGPLLRRATSIVDAEQQQVRQSRRGALTRSGLDLALVVLAAVAYWQLRTYQSPVLASGGIDAVLVAGPALFLLAGAALTLRTLPLVAALAERAAARSRRLVLPLAAWEVGRRPGRAAGAVLLLTLAVAVGVFSQSFLATWRGSQLDQADVQVGADLRIDRLATAPLEQSAAIAALPGAAALSPVAVRSVGLGTAPTAGMLPSLSSRVDMVALDTQPDADPASGSASTRTDLATVLAAVAPTDVVTGATLPGTPTALRLMVTATVAPAAPTLRLLESVVVQDARGLRVTFRLPAVAADGAAHTVTVPLTSTPDAPLLGPLAVIGLGSQLIEPLDPVAVPDRLPERFELQVAVAELRAVQDGVDTPAEFGPTTWLARSLPDQRGDVRPIGVTADDAGSLTTRGTLNGSDVLGGTAGFTTTTFAPVDVVPVIASAALLDQLTLRVGDRILFDVDGSSVTAEIAASTAYLPSMPRAAGFLVDRDLLTRTLVAAGWTDPLLDEWWATADAEAAPALAAAARTRLAATVTSRYELGAALTDGPLPIGVQTALWTVTAASLLLAVAGFAMSATISVRLRRLEFARLEALGASRPGLVRAVLAEHTLLGALGLGAGAVLGALLGRLVVPLLTVAADGARPVPAVVVHWPWAAEGALLAVMVTLIYVAVTAASVALLRPATSSLLRLGDDR
ncbi:FtsX-like permease family protein [Pengzhenrongella phosphoraccumulans]|uniref:FtsX-like permease family protein n=1 Tax=Pengzhenrongella phosphoraccumulans TaxID=3114394 RepID=UPI00388F2213